MKLQIRPKVGLEVKVLRGHGISQERDPTVPDWAKQPEKPVYSYEEIQGAPQELTNLEIEELINSMGGF